MPPASAPPAAAPIGPPQTAGGQDSLQRFDRLAESVTVAVRAYEDRSKLFGSRQLDCGGLGHGLTMVEDLWTKYNIGKKNTRPLDAARTARDQTLYAAVDSAERHFDQSQCDRP